MYFLILSKLSLIDLNGLCFYTVAFYPHNLVYSFLFFYGSSASFQTEFASHPPKDMETALKERVASAIAKYAVPDFLLFIDSLPKTRSGKIMRRVLRKIAANQEGDLGDVSTLADPSVVEAIIAAYRASKETGS